MIRRCLVLIFTLMVLQGCDSSKSSDTITSPAIGVTMVSAGSTHSCGIFDGSAMCWGGQNEGALGNNKNEATSAATRVQVDGLTTGVTALASHRTFSCAVVSGAVKCWGTSLIGSVDGTATGYRSIVPAQVKGLTANATAVAVGLYHGCALISGGVKCWGSNSNGQLGSTLAGSSISEPVAVDGLTTGVTAIAAGVHSTCAVVSGGVKCWGVNTHGQLGDGTTTTAYSPVTVTNLPAGTGIASLAIGGDSDGTHVCAVTTAGAVMCWGANGKGQLGNGTTTDSKVPAAVSGLTTGASSVAAGVRHSCAILTSGKVKCWGYNNVGQLGNGSVTDASSPVEVSEITTSISSIAAGGTLTAEGITSHSCVTLADKSAKCWGGGRDGQLGNGGSGTGTQATTPTAVVN